MCMICLIKEVSWKLSTVLNLLIKVLLSSNSEKGIDSLHISISRI